MFLISVATAGLFFTRSVFSVLSGVVIENLSFLILLKF